MLFLILGILYREREMKDMKEDACILCGRAYPAGLQILGCLICFPCEKRLLRGWISPARRRRLARIYRGPEG